MPITLTFHLFGLTFTIRVEKVEPPPGTVTVLKNCNLELGAQPLVAVALSIDIIANSPAELSSICRDSFYRKKFY